MLEWGLISSIVSIGVSIIGNLSLTSLVSDSSSDDVSWDSSVLSAFCSWSCCCLACSLSSESPSLDEFSPFNHYIY